MQDSEQKVLSNDNSINEDHSKQRFNFGLALERPGVVGLCDYQIFHNPRSQNGQNIFCDNLLSYSWKQRSTPKPNRSYFRICRESEEIYLFRELLALVCCI